MDATRTMIKTAFSTLSCPDWNWDTILQRGPEYGYDGVELRLLGRETDLLKLDVFRPHNLPQRRRELAETGFAVCGLASSVRFDHADANRVRDDLAAGRAYIELAAELEAGFVRVFGDVLPTTSAADRERVLNQIAAGLDELGIHAARYGVWVLLETHGDFADSSVTRALMLRTQSPPVGVLWDTHHPWRFCGEPLPSTFERLQPWIRHTHWKDSVSVMERPDDEAARAAARQAHALMSGHRDADYVLFGAGEFPAAECMELLKGGGYESWCCLEWEKMWHPHLADPEQALPGFPAAIKELWRSAGNLPE